MPLPLILPPRTRRIVQATIFEALALAVVTPVMARLFDHPPLSSFVLSATMSTLALAWNYVFNTAFERWEARQAVAHRSWLRRLVHGAAFETGLTLMLVPLMAAWLGVSLLEAFVADIGLLLFFFVYTVAFTWAFDKVVALPLASQVASARP